MQTIEQLADCFFTKYSEEAIKKDVGAGALSSTMYHERLCEQVREIIEYHVTEALKAANNDSYHFVKDEYLRKHTKSILAAYPLEKIK